MLSTLGQLYGALNSSILTPIDDHFLTAIDEVSGCLPAAFWEGCVEVDMTDANMTVGAWGTLAGSDETRKVVAAWSVDSPPKHRSGDWAAVQWLLNEWAGPARNGKGGLFADLFLEFDVSSTGLAVPFGVLGVAAPHVHVTDDLVKGVMHISQGLGISESEPVREAMLALRSDSSKFPQSWYVRNIAFATRDKHSTIRLVSWMNLLSLKRFLDVTGFGCLAEYSSMVMKLVGNWCTVVGVQHDLFDPKSVAIEIAIPPPLPRATSITHLLHFLIDSGLASQTAADMIERWMIEADSISMHQNLMLKLKLSDSGFVEAKTYFGFIPTGG